VSNARRLPRAAKKKAVRALARESECPDCGAKAPKPRRSREGQYKVWQIDIPHSPTCPSRRLPGLQDAIAADAIMAAQPEVGFPMLYLPQDGVVIAGER
jgi:hypothetical protein